MPFPNVNDKVEYEARKLMEFKGLLRECFAVLKSWLFGSLVIVVMLFAAWLS